MKRLTTTALIAFAFVFSFFQLSAQVDETDSLALVELYNSADGDNWSNNSNWLVGNVDTWFGIGVTGDRVTGIDLSNDGANYGNNLNGEITPFINFLPELTSLDLSGNPGLAGTGIPTGIWDLTNLTFLSLSYNQLGGEIPPEVSNLINLTNLRLEGNEMYGDIPAEIWTMTTLIDLSLNENQFTGEIPPEVADLASLVWLNLQFNELEGSIPAEIGQLANLLYLNLHNNQFGGSLTPSIGDLTGLVELRFSANILEGSIPAELGNLTNLQILEGAWNAFSGPIPPEIGDLTNLYWLDFRNNQLSGEIPTELSQLTNVTTFLFGRNQLEGTVPTFLGSMTNIWWLALGNNQFSGEIPTELGSMTGLTNLGLGTNNLTGAVPASFQNLVNLDRFNVSFNQLEDLPDMSGAANVTLFNVSNNRFDFGDLEPITGLNGLDYSNQDPFGGEVEEIDASVGEAISLDATIGGSSNNYEWKKEGQLMEGVTGAVIDLDPFAMEDGGKYTASITSDLVPGLTIESKAFDINPAPPSAAPTDLTATASDGIVTLEWTDNSYNENAWEIQRNLFGSYSIVAVVTKDTLVTPGSRVTQTISAPGNASMLFKVAAVNDLGTSDFSNEASVDVDLSPPFIRTLWDADCPGINVEIQDGNVNSNPNTGGFTQFILERSLDSLSGYAEIATIQSTANMGRPVYKDTDVADNTTYYYRVAAQTGDGASTTDFSAGQSFAYGTCEDVTNPLDVPFIIDGFAVSSSQALIRIFRSANYNVGDQVIIERAIASVGTFVQIVNVELTQRMIETNLGEFTYVDEGLSVGVDYIYRAFATNASETTDYSGEVWVTPEATDFEVLNFPSLNDIIDSQGVSWADYDLDGYDDLFISTFVSTTADNFTNVLIKNDGGTGVTDVSSLTGIDDGVLSRTGNWGDYNNDGLIDLFVADASSSFGDLLYFNNGDVTFTKAEPQFFNEYTNAILGHNLGAAADVDNDGFLDIATYSINFKYDFIKLYRNNGDATFSSEILSDRLDASWTGVWGDYDNDGDMDLFVGTDTFSPNFLFENDGAGNLIKNEDTILDDEDVRTRGSSWADYDNDGDLDLYVAGSFGDFGELYQNDGQGDFVKVTEGSGLENANATRAIVWQDFDNDGDLDMFTAMAGNAFFFDNNGDGTFTENTGVIPRNTGFMTGSSSGDFNKDGKRDLIITSTSGGASPLLYINKNTNGNNYLDVKLAGTISNTTAIGSKVRIRIGDDWQMRQIVNLTGANGQNSLTAHFGLGTATNVDSLVVQWPSGQITSLSDVSPNQQLNIVEDPVVDTNSPPVAVSIETPFTYNEGDEITLQAIDPDGDELTYEVTQDPVNGTLASVNSLDSLFTFTPNAGLEVNQVYEDSIKFTASDAAGVASNEAIIMFNYFIPDGPHAIDTIIFDQSTGDFDLIWDDNTLNDTYNVEITYVDTSDPENVVERTLVSTDVAVGDLSVVGDSITYEFTANNTDDPFLFSATIFFVNVTVTSPSGQSSNDGFTIDTSSSGRVSEDGLFFAFAGRSSVPENETVNLRLMAVELGEFSLNNSSINIIVSPKNGDVGTPVLVKETENIYIWDLEYESTADIGGLDSVQFEITHAEREIEEEAWARVEIVDVNDRPTIATIEDKSMTEDGTLSVFVDVSDPEGEVDVEILTSNEAIETDFDENVLTIESTDDFFGEVAMIVIADDGSFTALESFTLTVEPANDPPVINPLSESFTVIEDNRLNVPVFAEDPEQNNALITFSASSDDPSIATASFDRNLLSVSPVENANGSVEITIVADDGTETATAISEPLTFTVEYTPVNDAPVVVNSLAIQNLVEDQPDITIDLANHFFDPESGTDLTYSVTGDDGLTVSFNESVATIGISAGFTGAEILNFVASDGELSSIMQTSFVVTAVSSDITVASPVADRNLDEDFDQQIIDISSVFSASNPLTYSVTGGSLVEAFINENDELIINSLEDVSGTEELLIFASDGVDAQFESFSITINAINDVPEVDDLSFVLAENTANSTILGKVAASDVDSESFTYAITAGNTDDAFAISSTSGDLSVNDVTVLNFEQNPSFDLTVTVTDNDSGASDATVSVDLIDIDEKPSITTAVLSVEELSDVGTVVGTVGVDNPISTSLTFSFVGNADGFTINESTGEVTLSIGDLDFETTPVVNLVVNVDNVDAETTSALTIDVIDVNETPSIDNETFSIQENSVENTFVGLVTGDDPDDDELSYSITDGNTETAFEIDDETGIITVNNSSALNFEGTSTFNLTITADDGELSSTAQVTVNLTNQNEVPSIDDDQSFSILENVEAGDVVGTVAASDEDGDALSFSILSGNDDGAFAIAASSGEITVSDPSNFDGAIMITLSVEASDGELATSADVTIDVSALGIEDDLLDQVEIYPVPASQELTIAFGEEISADHLIINLVDLSGKTVSHLFEGKYAGRFSEWFNLPKLETGIYLIRIQLEESVETRRVFIKQ